MQTEYAFTLPRGNSEVSGSFTEASIPNGYYYYRNRLQGYACNSLFATTNLYAGTGTARSGW